MTDEMRRLRDAFRLAHKEAERAYEARQAAWHKANAAHAAMGVCLGCEMGADEPMAGYTNHCASCGKATTHEVRQ